MTWIEVIPYAEAAGRLKVLYDRVKGPSDNVDNIMMAHSLRPHTMEGHMALYKQVLHHTGNMLPKWFLETLGVYVSLRNGCAYCVDHHFAGLKRIVGDDGRATEIRTALETQNFSPAFSSAEQAALMYAKVLTEAPLSVGHETIARMRDAGLDDGKILEINQVVAYFAYANRTVLGLGVSTAGDILGLSPGNSANPDDWQHR